MLRRIVVFSSSSKLVMDFRSSAADRRKAGPQNTTLRFNKGRSRYQKVYSDK
jgi:hypothetical protein